MSCSSSRPLMESVHRQGAFWELRSHVVGGGLARDSKDPSPGGSSLRRESHKSSFCVCLRCAKGKCMLKAGG